MKPVWHATQSAKKYGGLPVDYLDIHDFMDSTKSAIADVRHRAILHNAFGCFILEKVFGHERTNSEGKKYSVRDVAEDHILEDLGKIPSVQDWLSKMPIENWMGKGTPSVKRGQLELPPTATNPFQRQGAIVMEQDPSMGEDVFIDGANEYRLKMLEEGKINE